MPRPELTGRIAEDAINSPPKEETMKQQIGLRWPEVDRITLKAEWFDDGMKFKVQRYHGSDLRASWVFTHLGRNCWQCSNHQYHWKKREWPWSDKKRSQPDLSRIPEDVKRMAGEFLARELEFRVKEA